MLKANGAWGPLGPVGCVGPVRPCGGLQALNWTQCGANLETNWQRIQDTAAVPQDLQFFTNGQVVCIAKAVKTSAANPANDPPPYKEKSCNRPSSFSHAPSGLHFSVPLGGCFQAGEVLGQLQHLLHQMYIFLAPSVCAASFHLSRQQSS